MRGKVHIYMLVLILNRITPAYAGKSAAFPCKIHPFWDHPRLCGEKCPAFEILQLNQGSPPPMRGKVVQHLFSLFETGITPAYAGKSSAFVCNFGLCKDHPRLCGEKFNCFTKFRRRLGSPPPMRGKDAKAADDLNTKRITPAYAGKRFFGLRRTGKL